MFTPLPASRKPDSQIPDYSEIMFTFITHHALLISSSVLRLFSFAFIASLDYVIHEDDVGMKGV